MEALRVFLAVFATLALTYQRAQCKEISAPAKFVRVEKGQLVLNGAPYRFIGTNFWYGLNLGSEGLGGDRLRLQRELDRLAVIGVTNLRILGATEGPDSEPFRIVPTLQPAPGVFEERALRGLDFLLAEMGKRGMKAVICLNDFWHWSGGMAQYRHWSTGLPIPYPPPAFGGDWNIFSRYATGFLSDDRAIGYSNQLIRTIVLRKNSYASDLRYIEDPTIMAWELANEPRGMSQPEKLNRWITATSVLIKNLDPNHLVTTGSEGETPDPKNAGVDFKSNHAMPSIDYATAHIWVQNWGWYDPMKPKETLDLAIGKMKTYFTDHVRKAASLGKPLVVEEFGISRDFGSFDPKSSVSVRDRYYREVFEAGYESAKAGPTLAGINFWAWAGEARPPRPGGMWAHGDPWIGDPPHEPQGWYSVYESDRSTISVIANYISKMNELSRSTRIMHRAETTPLDSGRVNP